MKTTWEIEAAAAEHALSELKAVRPDLTGKDVLALAQMVARTASAETVKLLREAGHFEQSKSHVPDDVIGPLLDKMAPLVDTAKTLIDSVRAVRK